VSFRCLCWPDLPVPPGRRFPGPASQLARGWEETGGPDTHVGAPASCLVVGGLSEQLCNCSMDVVAAIFDGLHV
jgi:hypothetical protein